MKDFSVPGTGPQKWAWFLGQSSESLYDDRG